ncbi:MAG: urea carboxylase-associated family protein [Chloroflexota bacterium]|nr:urea carboxylase-associated family protein [Chloroflexota bacterium]
MANVLVGHRAVAARQIEVGAAAAFDVASGQLIQIIDLAGKQVASMVAFGGDDRDDALSTSVTMTANASLVLKIGDKLYSARRMPLLELVEDSVGRHDLLTAALPPETGTTDAAGQSTNDALVRAMEVAELAGRPVVDAIHFFKHVVIKQRGELEVRESFAERNDTVVLRALTDGAIVVANAYPEKKVGVGTVKTPNGRAGQILVRVYH